MSESPRPTPKRLADFEVIRRLGVGGMAEVFLAKKRGAEGTYKLLVLKRVLPQYGESRRFRAMFAEEAQLATRLNHPNIVQVYDFQDYGEEGQLLSMEYVEGPDLRKLTKAARAHGARLPPFVAAFVVGEVAKGLHYAHERKDEGGHPIEIVHRDVSPQNVLLSFDGAVKIADFGIATANMFREEPGVLKGKTAYMSPEQAAGQKVDRRTDLYSLGVVFHELLTGRSMHAGLDGDPLLEAVRAGHVEPPSTYARDVPPELEAIVMRALAKDREDRYRTGRDLAAAVTRALFQRQLMIDAHVLEGVIAQLVSREHTSPGAEAKVEPQSEVLAESNLADLRGRGTNAEAGSSERTGAGNDDGDEGPGARAGREVRHVAVLSMQLHGLAELEASIGASNAARVVEQMRSVISEIAYKRAATWTWSVSSDRTHQASAVADSAAAILGLSANPARAASDAAWLAVDVHEAIHGFSDDLPVELGASVGLLRGIATGQRDRQGHLVNYRLQEPAELLANVLSTTAPRGATWVAGGIYRLVRRDFVWGDVPPLEIADTGAQDVPRNMRVYALERPLTRDEKLQEMALAPSDLIGRDAELADLHAAFHSAVARSDGRMGHVVARVVQGELGIGKTALVSTFLAELPGDARVLRIEASPVRSEVPFASVGEWVRELTGITDGQSVAVARTAIAESMGDFAGGKHGAEIVQRMAELAVGVVTDEPDVADAAHQRRLIASGLRRFFARAAIEAPLVVIIEGVQWCDRPSLELIAQLVRRDDPLPLLAVLVTRPDERVASFIDGLVRIELSGLSNENQVRLLQARLGATGGVALVCADLIPRAAGNPFFLLEMVDALLERGTIEIRERPDGSHELVRVDRSADAGRELPSTLEQLIADRLEELPLEERRIVDWLSAAGGPLSDADLAKLAGAEAEDAAVRLCARGICDRRGESVDVRYPLTRDVAYLALDRTTRVRMHRALGELLDGTPLAKGPTAAIVARHLARGNSKSRAADLYLEAANAARAGVQTSVAARYFRRVVALLPDDDLRRLEAHEALEAICRIQGRWRERRAHVKALRALAKASQKPYWVALALLRTARLELDAGHLARGLSSAQRSEQVAHQARSPILEVQAQSMIAEMLRDLGDMQGALAACDRALLTAGRPGVPQRSRAEVLRARGTLLRRVGRVEEAVEAHAEAIAVFRREGARRLEARAKNSLAFAVFVLGQFEDAISLLVESIRIDLAIGGRFQMAKTLSNIGQCYARMGDFPRAFAYLRRAREAHERYGDQDSRADTLLATAEALLETGDLAAADTLVGDAGALTTVTGSAYDSVHEKILRALLARATGDSGAAVMHAFDARQSAEAQAYVAFHFYAMAVEAAARVDIGEHHTGILLATTALGAMDTIRGSEYGLETRALCCEAMQRAGSPQHEELRSRAAAYTQRLGEGIRDEALRGLFFRRVPARQLIGEVAGTPTLEPRSDRELIALIDAADQAAGDEGESLD